MKQVPCSKKVNFATKKFQSMKPGFFTSLLVFISLDFLQMTYLFISNIIHTYFYPSIIRGFVFMPPALCIIFAPAPVAQCTFETQLSSPGNG